MKKLIALLLCLLLVCSSAFAEETQPIYTEDFEDGEHDFYFWGGDGLNDACQLLIEEEDGNHYLRCICNTGDGPNGYIHFLFGPSLRNFDYTCRVVPYIKNPDYNWLKILFRAQDAKSEGLPGGEGGENNSYMFNIWEWRGTFTIKSVKGRKSESNPLAENEDFWFDPDVWYEIRVEARENHIAVYVDDELCVEYTDPEDFRPDGIFGFCSWGANFLIDDISITAVEG